MPWSPNPAAPQQVAPLLALATQLLKAGRASRCDRAVARGSAAAAFQSHHPARSRPRLPRGRPHTRMPSRHCSGPSPATRATAMHTSAWESPWRSWATLGGAIVAYDRATQLLPALTEAWFRAGALVYTLGHREEAIGCFRRAAATGGNTSFGRLGKARALLTEDRNQEAEQVLRRTVARDPSNAMAHDLLGNLLSEFGRFDEARECFERAIAIAPLLAGCYYDLVRCRPRHER